MSLLSQLLVSQICVQSRIGDCYAAVGIGDILGDCLCVAPRGKAPDREGARAGGQRAERAGEAAQRLPGVTLLPALERRRQLLIADAVAAQPLHEVAAFAGQRWLANRPVAAGAVDPGNGRELGVVLDLGGLAERPFPVVDSLEPGPGGVPDAHVFRLGSHAPGAADVEDDAIVAVTLPPFALGTSRDCVESLERYSGAAADEPNVQEHGYGAPLSGATSGSVGAAPISRRV